MFSLFFEIRYVAAASTPSLDVPTSISIIPRSIILATFFSSVPAGIMLLNSSNSSGSFFIISIVR